MDKYKQEYKIGPKRVKAIVELIPGDRCPADSWRVSLMVDGKEIMFKEYSEGLNGENYKEAEIKAKKLQTIIERALHNA